MASQRFSHTFSRFMLGRAANATSEIWGPKRYTKLPNHRPFTICYKLQEDRGYTFASGEWQKSVQELPVSRWSKINLITWNIKRSDDPARPTKAIECLKNIGCDSQFDRVPLAICLQEVTQSSLDVIKSTSWVQANFQPTNIDSTSWSSTYGTITLIDRRLPIASTFRVPYQSKQGRDALFLDFHINQQSEPRTVPIRLCNTHLESFNDHPPVRAGQLTTASKYLHSDTVRAGIIAGDFNSVCPNVDDKLHLVNGLKDAFLEGGGKGQGLTWGMHSKRFYHRRYKDKNWLRTYRCGRFDKIMYTGDVEVSKPETFGRYLKVKVVPRGDCYVSDHLGLLATMEFQ